MIFQSYANGYRAIDDDGVITLVTTNDDYTVTTETLIEVTDTSEARTITLPDASARPAGVILTVKDGTANTNSITLAPPTKVVGSDGMVFELTALMSGDLSVDSATIAALPAVTYASGVLTAVADGALEVDGAEPSAADTVLVKDQLDPRQNGTYTVTATGGVSDPFVLTRTSDLDQDAEFIPGTTVLVGADGDTLDGNVYVIRGGIDGGKSVVISAAFGSARLYSNGSNYRVL